MLRPSPNHGTQRLPNDDDDDDDDEQNDYQMIHYAYPILTIVTQKTCGK